MKTTVRCVVRQALRELGPSTVQEVSSWTARAVGVRTYTNSSVGQALRKMAAQGEIVRKDEPREQAALNRIEPRLPVHVYSLARKDTSQ